MTSFWCWCFLCTICALPWWFLCALLKSCAQETSNRQLNKYNCKLSCAVCYYSAYSFAVWVENSTAKVFFSRPRARHCRDGGVFGSIRRSQSNCCMRELTVGGTHKTFYMWVCMCVCSGEATISCNFRININFFRTMKRAPPASRVLACPIPVDYNFITLWMLQWCHSESRPPSGGCGLWWFFFYFATPCVQMIYIWMYNYSVCHNEKHIWVSTHYYTISCSFSTHCR